MAEALFHTYELRRTIENQRQALDKEINSLRENEVLQTSHQDMLKYLTEKWKINPLMIDHHDRGQDQTG